MKVYCAVCNCEMILKHKAPKGRGSLYTCPQDDSHKALIKKDGPFCKATKESSDVTFKA